ncbi:MAG: signal recognition particle protein, partial [Pseudonocardiales bacterium]
QINDRDLDQVAAVIRSMTPAERHDPKIINGSRRLRIANGSGTSISDVNQLVDRFFEARKMMKQMAGMGMMGMGARRKATKSPKNKRKGTKGGGKGGRAGSGGGARQIGSPAGNPTALPGGALPSGLPPGFKMPNIDLSKLQRPARDS